jgi:hypothetical protein
MKRLLLLTLLLSLLAACTSGDDGEGSAPEIEGPALVMFYTDN